MLDYAGTGVLKSLTSETPPSGGALQSVGRMLSNVVRGAAVATGYRVPFIVRGTFDNPQFSLARTPQPVPDQNSQQPQRQPAQPQQRVPQDR
jgi:hypothetical protein